MSRGYSLRLAKTILAADPDKLGVQLGRACLRYDIPVSEAASQLGVSRQSVYNWFCGIWAPSRDIEGAIRTYLAAITEK